MFYTIYKITNKINGKIYIGKHQTKDLNDGYMGSGIYIKKSISKYGIENFEKEILFQFDNEDEMNAKEVEIVTEEFVLREDTYNICVGGYGGFSYINSSGKRNGFEHRPSAVKEMSIRGADKLRDLYQDDIWKNEHMKSVSRGLKSYFAENQGNFFGKTHSEETKKKIGSANSKNSGSKNSQFGTMWITNGKENKKIKKDVDVIPEGWYKGRK